MDIEVILADLSLRLGLIEKIIFEKGLITKETYIEELEKSAKELTDKINKSME